MRSFIHLFIFLMTGPVMGIAQVNLNSGLVAYWPLNNSLNDVVSGNHWTNHGSLPNDFGYLEACREFNKTENGQFCEAASIHLYNGASLGFWYYSYGNQPEGAGIIMKTQNSPCGDRVLFGARTAANDSVCFFAALANGDSVFITTKAEPSRWIHFVWVFHGNQDSYACLYQDGQKTTRLTSTNALLTPVTKMKMGMQCNSGQSFKGRLDEVGVWNRPLSGQEALALYHCGQGNPWPFSIPQACSNPCPGIPTISYGGQTYNTVKIGSQCWMKENLNIGVQITPPQWQADNGIIEKYCLDDDPANCEAFGGLYQWYEIMGYTQDTGTRGICPEGWHIPDNQEFIILKGYADSYYDENSVEWTLHDQGYRGFDAGHNLKAGNGWGEGFNGSDAFGFTALSGGYLFWTSVNNPGNSNDFAWRHYPGPDAWGVAWNNWYKWGSLSVRCIRDHCPAVTLAVCGPDQYNLAQTSINLSATPPGAGENGYWSITRGNNGNLQNPADYNTSFTGMAGESYVLQWMIYSNCGSASSDEMVVTFAAQSSPPPAAYGPCPGHPVVVHEGKSYTTLLIGAQCWMKENLDAGVMLPTKDVQNKANQQSNNNVTEKFCHNNNPAHCDTYGGLYQWGEMMNYHAQPGVQGICPDGWHVPTFGEWQTLITMLGGTNSAGSALKAEGSALWQAPNTRASITTVMNAPASGLRAIGGGFFHLGTDAHFWTSTPYKYIDIRTGSTQALTFEGSPDFGFAVKCMKNP